jgi:hypothetical protein
VSVYREQTKQQLLLLWLWNQMEAAYEAQDSDLTMQVFPSGPNVGVYVDVPVDDEENPLTRSRRVNISDEIPELDRGGEAFAVFSRLEREGYIFVHPGVAGSAKFRGLSTKGLIEIAKLPEPGKRLAEAFDAVRHNIEQQDLAPEKKRAWLQTLAHISTLAKNTPDVAQQITDALGQISS